jgi:hypothetical protein
MFNLVHSKYKEGCQDKGLANVIQTNPSFAQQEYRDSITSPSDNITAIVQVRCCACKEEGGLRTLEGIISNNIN